MVSGRSPCLSRELRATVGWLSGHDLDLGLDLDRKIEGQSCHAHCRARVAAALVAVKLDDQVAEAIDAKRETIKSVVGVHHAEQAEPVIDTIQIAKRRLQARQHGQRGQSCRPASLLLGDVATDLAKRPGNRAVRLERPVPGNEGSVASDPDPGKSKRHPGREPYRRWK